MPSGRSKTGVSRKRCGYLQGETSGGSTGYVCPPGRERSQDAAARGPSEKERIFPVEHIRFVRRHPAGRYAVTIIYRSPEKKEDDENAGPDLLQGRYADPKTTPLAAEVKKETNNLAPFQIQ